MQLNFQLLLRLLPVLFIICLSSNVLCQSNLRKIVIPPGADSIALDSLPIVPGSEIINLNGIAIDPDFYRIDHRSSVIHFSRPPEDTVFLTYRVFLQPLNMVFRKKESPRLKILHPGEQQRFTYIPSKEVPDYFRTEGINKNGSISRGITFGNNQDLAVNSNLNLQMSGKITESIHVLAAVTDNNIPIQPEGNTQQLQQFDQVYIQLYDQKNKLVAGDFVLESPQSHFMKFYKRAQGGNFSNTASPGASTVLRSSVSAAVSKGKFSRNVIQGLEGNQGPYRLRGNENEMFIIILSGTERVFIDGALMIRGQENDYVIDYNTAEITFTAKRLITKDKRILVEFQYSERSYARSLIFASEEFASDKLSLRGSFYSEQDSRNQPLLQDLDEERKAVLAAAGDSARQAVVSTIRNTGFNPNVVNYRLTDTIIDGVFIDSVLIFSTDPELALYQAAFSQVGENRGNYRQVRSTANGKVFEFVAPVGGIPQGSFEPVTLLVPPRQLQMANVAGTYAISPGTVIGLEIAGTKNDRNTFSDIDNADDNGSALRSSGRKNFNLSADTSGWQLIATGAFEYISPDFAAIERFRPVEFERDWNIAPGNLNGNQLLPSASASIAHPQFGALTFESALLTTAQYQGNRQLLFGSLQNKKYEVNTRNSYTNTSGSNGSTAFIRQQTKVTRKLKWFNAGLWEDQERNLIQSTISENLSTSSFEYFEWEAFVANTDTATNTFNLSYRQRVDKAPLVSELLRSTFAETFSASLGLNKNPNSIFRAGGSWRKLQIVNKELTSLRPDNTVVGRVEHQLKFFRGALMFNSFYEAGSGQEVKREFTYLEVQAGQGTYAWLGDINGNGSKDINEFEIAAFPDQARYIRVFTPTSDYVRAYSTQFSEGVTINPYSIWASKKGIRKVFSRFSEQGALRIERKTGGEERIDAFNPFGSALTDTALITLNSSLRNTIFFNRNSPIYALNHTWQDNRQKTLMVNGYETRTNQFHQLNGRLAFFKSFTGEVEATLGEKTSRAEFFINRNYQITYRRIIPSLTYQPGTIVRATINGTLGSKKNDPAFGVEVNISKGAGFELRYNQVTTGTFSVTANYIYNRYSGEPGSVVSFEMLEGLQPGQNLVWTLNWQRNIAKNMQLTLNYMGRISETAPAVHTGGAQLRAFF